MSNKKTPRYGQIVVHENAAGLAYCRFLDICEDDPRKFRCRVVDPTTMRVVRWTQEDADAGRVLQHAVDLNLPVMGWGWLSEIKFAGTVKSARKFWDSVHWGPVVNKETAEV